MSEELANAVFPFFDRWRETSDVLRAVDAGEVDARKAIAGDRDRNLYHLALLRFQAGQIAEAASCLRELVENTENKGSNALEWETLRAEAARIGLLTLEKTLAK